MSGAPRDAIRSTLRPTPLWIFDFEGGDLAVPLTHGPSGYPDTRGGPRLSGHVAAVQLRHSSYCFR